MRWRSPVSCHILGDRGLTHIDAELEEFAVDPGRAPQRVGEAHIPDQLTDSKWDLRSAYPRARLPSPEQAKPGPVPADSRLREPCLPIRRHLIIKINDPLVLIRIGRRIPCDGQPHQAKGPMRANALAAENKAVDRAAP
jgi:hypothetical protein